MPALFLWLQSIVTGIVSALSAYATRRAALAVAYVTVAVAAAVTLTGAVVATVSGVLLVAPEAVAAGASWVIPANTPALVGAYLSTRVLCMTYLFTSTWKNPLRAAG